MLEFRSNNDIHRPMLDALDLIRRYTDTRLTYFPVGETVPTHSGPTTPPATMAELPRPRRSSPNDRGPVALVRIRGPSRCPAATRRPTSPEPSRRRPAGTWTGASSPHAP